MFNANANRVAIDKYVTWKNKRLRLMCTMGGWISGCGLGVIYSPQVVRQDPNSIGNPQLSKEELTEYLSTRWYSDLVGDNNAPCTWVLCKADRPGATNFEACNYIHDILMSGACGTVIVGPPVGNVYHKDDVFQSAVTTYIWIPPQNKFALMDRKPARNSIETQRKEWLQSRLDERRAST